MFYVSHVNIFLVTIARTIDSALQTNSIFVDLGDLRV